MVWVLVGVTGCVSRPTRLSLVTLFSLFMSIKDRLLLWMVVRSQTYYLEHILAYGSGKTCYVLVMGSGTFRTDWLEAEKGRGLSTILRPGLKCGGLESKFGRWTWTLWQEWNGFVLFVPGIQMGCVFQGTQLGYIDSRITVSVRRYDLAMVLHRSKNKKMKDGKMVLIAQPLLESRTCAYLEW